MKVTERVIVQQESVEVWHEKVEMMTVDLRYLIANAGGMPSSLIVAYAEQTLLDLDRLKGKFPAKQTELPF